MASDRHGPRPIGNRVLGITVALTVLFAAFGGWSLQHTYQQNKVDARRDVERTASLAGALAGQLVSSAHQGLFVLGASPSFRAGDVEGIRQHIGSLNVGLLGFRGNVSWADRTGAVQAQTPPLDPPRAIHIGDREYFRLAMETKRPVVSDLLIGRATGDPVVVFAMPTFGPDGEPNGLVSAAVNLDSLDPESLEGLFGTDTLTVLDRRNQTIVGREVHEVDLARLPADREVDSGTIEHEGEDDEDDSVIGWTRVNSAGWTILIERSSEEVYGAAYRQTVNSSVVLALLVAAALIGGLWASRRLNRSHMDVVRGEALIRTVLEQLPAAVVVVDRNRRSPVTNPRAEALLASISDRSGVPADDATKRLTPLRDALADGTVSRGVDVTIGDGDGERILNVSAAPVIAGGRITAATAVFDDVTDQRAEERQAREMAATLASLAAAEWPEQIGALVVDEGAPALGADEAALLLVEPGAAEGVQSSVLTPLAATGDGRSGWSSGAHPAHFLATAAARTGRVETRTISGDHEWVALPLHSAGRLSGILALGFPHTDRSPTGRMVLLRGFAAQVAQALDRSLRRRIEHDIGLQLQRSLLEPVEPNASGLDVACRYIPAESHLEVGGDLYDVITTPEGHTVLVIGDIVGHGLTAATAMGQLRSAIRTLSATTLSPARILDALDRGVGTMPACWMATAAILVVDPDGRRITYGVAGHPHPLVRHADGRVERLAAASGPPLGLAREPRSEGTLDLAPGGATVHLFTDGLVERRGETIEDGMDRAVEVVASINAPDARGAADQLLVRLVEGTRSRDDVALVCAVVPAASTDGSA